MSDTITPNTTSPQDMADRFRPPTLFLRIRTFLLGSIFFLSFVWSILLCIAVFDQWDNMNIVEHNMISIMLCIEFVTIILIPMLLAKEFLLWLDAARSLFLFAAHFGFAVWFACQTPSMRCIAGDEQVICADVILSILIFSWVIPVLVLVYSCGLGYFFSRVMMMRRMSTASFTFVTSRDLKRRKTISHASFHTSRHVSRESSGYAV